MICHQETCTLSNMKVLEAGETDEISALHKGIQNAGNSNSVSKYKRLFSCSLNFTEIIKAKIITVFCGV